MDAAGFTASPLDKHSANACFALFIAGAIAGAVQLHGPVPFGTGFEEVAIAVNLVHHGTFANPFWILKTGPTAANPPLYPLFLALVMKVLRLPSLILAMVLAGNVVMNALAASLLPRVSLLFFGDIMPGVIGSVLGLAAIQMMPAWDVSYALVGLLLFCLMTTVRPPETGKLIARRCLDGLIAGLLFLSNPPLLLIVAPWIAFLVLRRKMLLKHAGVIVVVSGIVFLPWMVRNKLVLGTFAPRTAFGMTFYAANNDCAQSSRSADEINNCYQSHHPNVSIEEAQLLRSMGEVKYDHLRTADTEKWIRNHPRRFAVLTLERVREFWFPPVGRLPYTSVLIWLATALSIPGIAMMVRRRQPEVWFILAVFFLYPLIYYIVVSDVRYRYSVLWLSLLPAGYFLQQILPIGSWGSRVVEEPAEASV